MKLRDAAAIMVITGTLATGQCSSSETVDLRISFPSLDACNDSIRAGKFDNGLYGNLLVYCEPPT